MYSILSSIFKAISIRQALMKATRGTEIIPYLSKYVSRGVLDKIYKFMCAYTCIMMTSFITNMTQSLNLTLPKSWNPSALAVTGAWHRTSTDRLCEEVGWEILYYRKWYRCLCHFYCKLLIDRRIVKNRIAPFWN